MKNNNLVLIIYKSRLETKNIFEIKKYYIRYLKKLFMIINCCIYKKIQVIDNNQII